MCVREKKKKSLQFFFFLWIAIRNLLFIPYENNRVSFYKNHSTCHDVTQCLKSDKKYAFSLFFFLSYVSFLLE